MSLTVTAAIHQAQESLDRGDYPQAATLCDRLVTQFPAYAHAWTLLGEAFREQGQNADAQRAYHAAATRHLRAPMAYQGLGLLAEEQGNIDGALAFCQVGWELSPADQSMREPLMRMAIRRYATDGELQYTLPALAQQHLRSSRLRRAVQAWRAAADQFPGRADVQAGLALALWRTGNAAEAEPLCEALLERYPESAEPLGILADISSAAGDLPRAHGLIERLRAIDPDGAIAERLCDLHPGANRDLLLVTEERVPLVDESIHGTVAERPRLAPAPDVDYVPARADAELAQLESLRLGDLGGPEDALPEPAFDPFAGALGVDAPVAAPTQQPQPANFAAPTDVDVDFGEDLLLEDLQPMSLEEFGAQPGEELPTFAPEHLLGAEDMEVGIDDSGLAAAAPIWDPWSEPAPEPAPAPAPATAPVAEPQSAFAATDDVVDWAASIEVPSAASAPVSDLAADLDAMTWPDVDEPAVEVAAPPVPEAAATAAAAADPRAEADIVTDYFSYRELPGGHDLEPETDTDLFAGLAADLRGDVSDALQRAGQTAVPQDGPIDSHRPPVDDPRGFTTVLRALDDEGIAPFDPRSREPIPNMPSMLMNDDEITNAIPSGQPATDRLGEIAHDWESIDAEIQAAMPAGYAPGYTDELRALDQIGLMPFEVELGDLDGDDEDDDHDTGQGMRTLDDILMGELVSITPVPSQTPAPAQPAPPAYGELDHLLGDLQPFAAEEFDQDVPPPVSPTQSFSFSQGAWEAAIGSSTAVPSDADLEALLNESDDDMPPPSASLTNELMLRQSTRSTSPVQPVAPPDPVVAEELDSDWQASGLAEDVAAVAAAAAAVQEERGEVIERDHSGTDRLAAELDALEALQALDARIAEEDRAYAAAMQQRTVADDAGDTDDAADATTDTGAAVQPDQDDRAIHEHMAALEEDDIVTAELGSPRLQPDPDMLDRARDAKRTLIDTGVITGMREFDNYSTDAQTVMLGASADADETADVQVEAAAQADAAAEDEATVEEPQADTTDDATATAAEVTDDDTAALTLPSEAAWSSNVGILFGAPPQLPEATYEEEDDEDDDIIHGIGATRDTSTLRAALGITPDDGELHWWLSEALRERGEIPAAVDEYRWLLRHAPERSDAVLQALLDTLERGQELELVHRMLGDVYRRRGDTRRASHHASQALLARRRANQAAQ